MNVLKGYCDADYAGDVISSKSTSGYVIEFCDSLISWASGKQPVVALSNVATYCGCWMLQRMTLCKMFYRKANR